LKVLDEVAQSYRFRRAPQVISYSYGSIPTKRQSPHHPAWDPGYPTYREVIEIAGLGVLVFFGQLWEPGA
jgi:hypothetical protein